jgi:hypothetical protein
MVPTFSGSLSEAPPCHGDVLVAFRNGGWEIGTVSTSPSITCASLGAAMAIARAFATVHHVDVWLAHDVSLRRVVSARTRAPEAVSV